jgi:hypothetical protein
MKDDFDGLFSGYLILLSVYKKKGKVFLSTGLGGP